MASVDPFIRSLVRVASLSGRDTLEAVILSNYTTVSANGWKQLVGTSAGGKSFSFAIPAGMDTFSVMGKFDEALTLFDSLTADQLTTILTRRRINRSTAAFSVYGNS